MISCPACSAKNSDASKFCSECGSALKSDYEATMTYSSMQPSEDSSTSSDSSIHGRFLPGTKLVNRYRIVSLLGKGGMGEVYRADDLRLGHTVALKFLPRHVSKDPKRLECFHSEVRLSRQISHPNVCRVYDIGDVDGQHFLSMEYIDGEDLRILLRRIGRIQKDKGIQLARQLCAGLAAAHEKGVLHRDLKPANMMIDGRGQVRITDFGLAQLASEGEREIAGTPAYMAPEQITRGETSIQSDLYSLGLILYEMFTGERVHKPDSFAQLRELHLESSSAKRPSEVVDDIEPAVERVIMQCLEREPKERPKSVAQVAASLPGSDPLAAAIAAGETPSPELVAASGDEVALSPFNAAVYFAVVVVGLILVAIFSHRAYLVNRLKLAHPPAVMEHLAKEIVRGLGYADPPAHSARGFEQVGGHTAVRFWYRQSPREMIADDLFDDGKWGFRHGRVSEKVPSWTEPGMVGVRLSPKGELRWFRAVTGTTTEVSYDMPSEAKWNDWFPQKYLGFNLDDLQSAQWSRTLPYAYDQMETWEGTWPESKQHLYVVAAAYRGHPVYFEVLTEDEAKSLSKPWPTERNVGGAIVVGLLFGANVAAVFLAWRNLLLGRGDRRSAWRLATGFLLADLTVWFCMASHVSTAEEYALFVVGIATATYGAIVMWVTYIAAEPFVRRRWPELLVSWTRLLGGRFVDARIGRDVLVGTAVGTCGFAFAVFVRWSGIAEPPIPVSPLTLLGPITFVGEVVGTLVETVYFGLSLLVMLLLLRIVVRSELRAAVCCVAVFVIPLALGRGLPAAGWLLLAITMTLQMWVLVRFGFLAYLAAFFAGVLLSALPITMDPTAFYFSNGLLGMFIVAATSLFGFYTSLGGKPVFGEVALETDR